MPKIKVNGNCSDSSLKKAAFVNWLNAQESDYLNQITQFELSGFNVATSELTISECTAIFAALPRICNLTAINLFQTTVPASAKTETVSVATEKLATKATALVVQESTAVNTATEDSAATISATHPITLLAKCVAESTKLKHLLLDSCQIGSEGLKILIEQGIAHNSSLETINLCGNLVDNLTFGLLVEHLLKNPTIQLSELSLTDNPLTFDAELKQSVISLQTKFPGIKLFLPKRIATELDVNDASKCLNEEVAQPLLFTPTTLSALTVCTPKGAKAEDSDTLQKLAETTHVTAERSKANYKATVQL